MAFAVQFSPLGDDIKGVVELEFPDNVVGGNIIPVSMNHDRNCPFSLGAVGPVPVKKKKRGCEEYKGDEGGHYFS